MPGYIKVYRGLLDDILKNPAMLQVWFFLSENAQYKKTVKDGIEVLPGQLLTTASEIGHACRLSANKVHYTLVCLEKQGLIRRENIRNRHSLITLSDPTAMGPVSQTTASQPQEKKAVHTPARTTAPAPDAGTQESGSQVDFAMQEVVPASDAKTQAVAIGADMETQAVVSACDAAKQADAPALPENGAKPACGMFNNVYLSAEEKRLLQQYSDVYESYINNLSAYKKRTGKTYTDDFTLLCEWISKDDIRQKRTAADRMQQEKPAPAAAVSVPRPRYAYLESSEPASYDLEKAERQARESVPKLRKRPKK